MCGRHPEAYSRASWKDNLSSVAPKNATPVLGLPAEQRYFALNLKHVQHFENNNDNDNDSDGVEDILVHG